MARAFNGSSQYLTRTATNFVAPPFSVAVWFYATSAAVQGTLWGYTDAAGFADRYVLDKNGDGTVSAIALDDFSGGIAKTTATYTASTWRHAAGVFASTASRSVYLDGGNKVTNTDTRNPSSLDNMTIGAVLGPSATFYHGGRIAEVAIWSAALTDDEIAALYNSGIGLSPTMVRPDALVAYYPLLQTDGDADWWGQNALTAVASPTYADHVPVIYPSGVHSVTKGPVSTFQAAWARGSNVIITPGVI